MHILQNFLIRAIILLGLTASLTGKGLAEERPYVYQHLDREDGLASNIVLAIMQDRQGFMWFGSDNGLQRFDGRGFVHYRFELNNANSLASDIVEALLEDKQGNLWVASPAQVTLFSPEQGKFTRIPILPAAQTSSLPRRWRLQECEGQIVLQSGNQQGTFEYDASRRAFVPLPVEQVPLLPCLSQTLAPATPLPGNEPYVYLKDNQGTVWAAAEKFWARRSGSAEFELIPEGHNSRYGLDHNLIYALTQSREGTIWLGTNKGIYYFNPGKQRFYTAGATDVDIQNRAAIAVTGFLETCNGEIYVSSINKDIKVYDGQLRLRRSYSQLKPQQVWCMVEDNMHRVWAGASDGTVLLLRNDKAPVEYLEPPVFANQTIVKVAIDAAGTIWWGTSAGLLVQHNPISNAFKSYPLQAQSKGQQIGQIQRILFGADGSLWVGTSQAGVMHLDARTGIIMDIYDVASQPHNLLSDAVGEITWYNEDTLLISTNLGLHFLDIKRKQLKALTTADGLPSNTILNLVKASDKHLFFTSQVSLSRWDMQTSTFTSYGARDGLLDESYAFNTGYTLRDGRIAFGTLQNFYLFHPDSLEKSPVPPNVIITGFRVFDKSLPVQAALWKEEGLSLAHHQNFFTIEFAALDFYNEAKISYEYLLKGVDKGWRQGGHNRFASYTNLEGGNYQFKVRARRDDGTTSAEVTTLNLVIANPFWKTGWFWALVLLALGAVLYSLYRLRINRLLALQQVRTRIARDLHDDMGSTLSTITIFSDMASQQVLDNPGLAQGYLNKISRYSHDMMTTMDDIVWSINPQNDSLQNLISRMRELATELLEAKNISFSIQADAAINAMRLPLESRYDCFMIYKEALNNLAKYSGCRHVTVKINLVNQKLQLEITDDGQGFDTQATSSGNGLQNMQRRARNINGQLQIQSMIGKGTTLLLIAPLPKKIFKPAPAEA